MSEYIDLNGIAESVKENLEVISKAALKAKQMVTEDMVIVIRCKDCKFSKRFQFHINDTVYKNIGCLHFDREIDENSFCDYGERREIDE